MRASPHLAMTFCQAAGVLPPNGPDAALPALDALLAEAWTIGHARWPQLELTREGFAVYLGERLRAGERAWEAADDVAAKDDDGASATAAPTAAPHDPTVAALLSRLKLLALGDLYLACGCVLGRAAALAAFESSYLAHLPALLARSGYSQSSIEDALQLVRAKLLVVDEKTGRPRIAEYSGRGALGTWLKVAALRTASTLRRSDKEVVGHDGIVGLCERLGSPATDPEMALIKKDHAVLFRQAMGQAIAALTPREQQLLRYRLVAQLSTVEIGRLHQVNQSTASRWLQEVRERLAVETKRVLRARMHLSPSELASLLRLVDSTLDLSLPRLLIEEAHG